jgi:hypothetical protein
MVLDKYSQMVEQCWSDLPTDPALGHLLKITRKHGATAPLIKRVTKIQTGGSSCEGNRPFVYVQPLKQDNFSYLSADKCIKLV